MSYEHVLQYQEELAKKYKYRPLSGAQREEAGRKGFRARDLGPGTRGPGWYEQIAGQFAHDFDLRFGVVQLEGTMRHR